MNFEKSETSTHSDSSHSSPSSDYPSTASYAPALDPTTANARSSECLISHHDHSRNSSASRHALQKARPSASTSSQAGSSSQPRLRVRDMRKTSRRVATEHQLSFLEPAFEHSQSLTSFSPAEKETLSSQTGMTSRQIGHWFQNRRRSLARSSEQGGSAGSSEDTSRRSSASAFFSLDPPSRSGSGSGSAGLGLVPGPDPVSVQPSVSNDELLERQTGPSPPDCSALASLAFSGPSSYDDLRTPHYQSLPQDPSWLEQWRHTLPILPEGYAFRAAQSGQMHATAMDVASFPARAGANGLEASGGGGGLFGQGDPTLSLSHGVWLGLPPDEGSSSSAGEAGLGMGTMDGWVDSKGGSSAEPGHMGSGGPLLSDVQDAGEGSKDNLSVRRGQAGLGLRLPRNEPTL